MKIGVPKETREGEGRVALVPDVVRSLRRETGVEVLVTTGAGEAAGHTDEDYESAGAEIVWDEEVWQADLLVCVNAPSAQSIGRLTESGKEKALIGQLDPAADAETIGALATANVTAFSTGSVPTGYQGMNGGRGGAAAAGYAAVMAAARESFPIFSMLTGGGPPARVLVLGAESFCLQALVSARKLGAITTGWDADEEDELVGERLAAAAPDVDVLITAVGTAPGPAPTIVTADSVAAMAAGSVIVDLAAPGGGNCELTKPGKTVLEGGVKVLGPLAIEAEMPVPASRLYAESVECLVKLLLGADGELDLNLSDEIVAQACMTEAGVIRKRAAAEFATDTGGA